MAWRKRIVPEINAGSMADIAFLLLIFFLVTTTMDVDGGIQRKLPPISEKPSEGIIHKRNLFNVLINARGQLMVQDQEIKLHELRQATVDFLDNNGDGSCSYCEGIGLDNLSVNPQKAVVSILNDRETPYRLYVAVQNELTAAYNELRNREAKKLFGQGFNELNSAQQGQVQELFPMKISEAAPVNL